MRPERPKPRPAAATRALLPTLPPPPPRQGRPPAASAFHAKTYTPQTRQPQPAEARPRPQNPAADPGPLAARFGPLLVAFPQRIHAIRFISPNTHVQEAPRIHGYTCTCPHNGHNYLCPRLLQAGEIPR